MKQLFFCLSISLLTAPAFAADVSVGDAPVGVVPGFTWTGGYLGGQVGYAWDDGGGHQVGGPGFTHIEPEGFIGGVYLGYNYQMSNNIVLGAEIDVIYSDVDGDGQAYQGPGVPAPGIIISQELNWSAAARARLGYAVDRFLPYIAGGVTFGDIDLSSPVVSGSVGDTFSGWTIGAGAEYAFTDNVIGRAEYRYSDFGSEIMQVGAEAEVDLTTNEIRFGIAYKF